MHHILIRYSEIALKGKNRTWFENILKENIRQKIKLVLDISFKLERIFGRILINFPKNLSTQQESKINLALASIFGITSFSWVKKIDLNINQIKKECWNTVRKEKKFQTFRITTQRSNKNFQLTSEELNQKIGEYIFNQLKKNNLPAQVNLKHPDLECFIEINDKSAFIYNQKIKGLNGLPVGSSGKALAFLSGGIDSPVAAYYGLRRGVKIDFIHFHALPYTTSQSIEKVITLAKILNQFQSHSKIFLIPLANIQNEIVKKSPAKYRLLFYRRFMIYLANQIAFHKKYLAFYTGESVGQVASQTLENIQITNTVSNLPILRPLIGFSKEEIIQQAQTIGTYKISILPHEDTCTRFIPSHPATRAHLHLIEKVEKEIDKEKLIKEALKNIEVKKIE